MNDDMIRFYDNGGKTHDRYTILFMWEREKPNGYAALGSMAAPGAHLGRRIEWRLLPQDVQKFVEQALNADPLDLSDFVDGYLECAAWADAPEGSTARFTKAARLEAWKDCANFIVACGPLLKQAMELREPAYLGHDFWLSRCGHGTGFWDRDVLEVPVCAKTQGVARFRKGLYAIGDELGDALHDIAYGTDKYISHFAYPSLTEYRGWLHFN